MSTDDAVPSKYERCGPLERGTVGDAKGDECADAAFRAAMRAVDSDGLRFPLASVESTTGKHGVDAFDRCREGLNGPVAC